MGTAVVYARQFLLHYISKKFTSLIPGSLLPTPAESKIERAPLLPTTVSLLAFLYQHVLKFSFPNVQVQFTTRSKFMCELFLFVCMGIRSASDRTLLEKMKFNLLIKREFTFLSLEKLIMFVPLFWCL